VSSLDRSFPIAQAHQHLGRELGSWCRMTIRAYRVLCLVGGVIYGAFLLALIGLLSTPY